MLKTQEMMLYFNTVRGFGMGGDDGLIIMVGLKTA